MIERRILPAYRYEPKRYSLLRKHESYRKRASSAPTDFSQASMITRDHARPILCNRRAFTYQASGETHRAGTSYEVFRACSPIRERFLPLVRTVQRGVEHMSMVPRLTTPIQ